LSLFEANDREVESSEIATILGRMGGAMRSKYVTDSSPKDVPAWYMFPSTVNGTKIGDGIRQRLPVNMNRGR